MEGRKEDEAHPAIYPTGELATKLSEEEGKLYDLIARRFLSVFADFAEVEHTNVLLSIGEEKYDARGSRLTKSGWLSFYRRSLRRVSRGSCQSGDMAIHMTQPRTTGGA